MRTTAIDEPRGRDVAPTGVRLPPDLRDQLVREAAINGRSLSAEIIFRLKSSVPLDGPATRTAADRDGHYGPTLDDSQRQLVTLFSALPPEKQLALLTLLRR